MKTPYTKHWIALDALGPEDEDAELRDLVSADLDERSDNDETATRRRAMAPRRRAVAMAGDLAPEQALPCRVVRKD